MFPKVVSLVFVVCCSFALGAEFYCPTVATKGEDRRTNTSSFRLVQFNAEWLFTDGADNCPGTTCPWKNAADASTHLSTIASVISNLNPDVVNLCEVESCNELTLLTQDSHLLGKGYKPYMVKGTDSSTGQDVGMLTKIDPLIDLYRSDSRVDYPIPGTTCKSTYYGDYGVSKHYVTTFKVGRTNIAMISAHLLAIPDDQTRCVEREAQATVLAGLVQPYVDQGFEIIILGDLNDWDLEVPDINNSTPISQVNAILKGQGQQWTLHNVASKLATTERYSEWWDENEDCVYTTKETSAIDHILVSSGLYSKITNVQIAHNEYAQSCDAFYYSDHWPVVVDFAML